MKFWISKHDDLINYMHSVVERIVNRVDLEWRQKYFPYMYVNIRYIHETGDFEISGCTGG